MRRANYSTNRDGKGPSLKAEEHWVYVPVPAIVSEELWTTCNQILVQQPVTKKGTHRKTVNLFSGFVQCHCGPRMYIEDKSNKYRCRKCNNRIASDDLEYIFQSEFEEFFTSSQEVATHLNQAKEAIKSKEALLVALQKDLEKVEREKKRIYQAFVDEQLTGEEFGQYHRPLAERLAQLQQEVPTLQGDIDFIKVHIFSSDHIVAEAKNISVSWHTLGFEQKRLILEQIMTSIKIGDGEVEFNFDSYPPALKQQEPGNMYATVVGGGAAGNRESVRKAQQTVSDW